MCVFVYVRARACICAHPYTFTFVLLHQEVCTLLQVFDDRQENLLPFMYFEFELLSPLHELGTFFFIFLDLPGRADQANWGNGFPSLVPFPFPTSLALFFFFPASDFQFFHDYIFYPFKETISQPSFIFNCEQLGKGIPKPAETFSFQQELGLKL